MGIEHQQPPRDRGGCVLPHNHPQIFDQHYVIRHIRPEDLIFDEDQKVRRVPSSAYSASSGPNGGMSVDIEDWITADGLDSLHYLGSPREGATRISVGALRRLGYRVGWDPRPENPHHGEVWGNFKGSGKRRAVQALAQTLRKADGED